MKSGCERQSPLSGWEPNYEPEKWNKRNEISDTHNCFSYAMNVNDPKQIAKCAGKKVCNAPFHQPGAAAGYRGFDADKPKTCPNMIMRILGDNPHIRMSTFEKKCPPKTSKIALVVDQSDDYHFLRQDSNQFWSQKSGARPVTNLDASKHRIWDPQLSDSNYTDNDSVLNYDVFCGYMCVPRDRPLFLKTNGGGGKRKGGVSHRARKGGISRRSSRSSRIKTHRSRLQQSRRSRRS